MSQQAPSGDAVCQGFFTSPALTLPRELVGLNVFTPLEFDANFPQIFAIFEQNDNHVYRS